MGTIAFLFAGQGAQHAGMGEALYESSPAARAVFDACEALRPGTREQCFHGDKETLSQTINTQPCLFAVDLACAAAAQEAGIRADAAAGFSLGEVAAAAFTGLLSLEDAFQLVCLRAEAMQKCAEAHPGAMLAVLKLEAEAVEKLCAEYAEAWPVNYNSPGQTVVACAAEHVEPLSQAVKAAGGRAMKLNVSGGFHTPWMRPATEALAARLATLTLRAPELPFYANRTGEPYALDEAVETLSKQASSPVRWRETLERMAKDGVDTFLEFGPGGTLTGLVKRTLNEVTALNAEDPEGIQRMVEALNG